MSEQAKQPSSGTTESEREVSVYDAVGGASFFNDLVERFYRSVAVDPLLRPMYPDDLTDSIRHLDLFLQQYWGGPTTYDAERGHPRLRQRHMPFVIGEAERDAWFKHMAAALDSVVTERGTPPELEAQMLEYFARAAHFMINTA